ncbi:ankyrin repeat-containing domain protein [Boeremia exigua]|uniref:ankyrin repeat-containing domain protein n=1 Tax=Boeremia exigua TaxID=749465 RepID=UPI001E8EC135|nr:ankyrin repeat-containing domain protein [Boeremia exigua]KAH6644844.1 ankyrin repeat-containing domain protein [Boeremia exigua]
MARVGLLALPTELLLLLAESFLDQTDISRLVCSTRHLRHVLWQPLLRTNIAHHGSTALLWAAANNHTDFAQVLVHLGANLETSPHFLEHACIPRVGRYWGRNVPHSGSSTPLCYAVQRRNQAMVELLVGAGALVVAVRGVGPGPFEHAYAAKHAPIIAVLTSQLRSVDAPVGRNGETPLQLACRTRYVDGVRRLLEHKADPNASAVAPKERFSHVRALLDSTSPGFYTYDRFDLPTGNPRDDALQILRMLFNCGLEPDESCRCRLFRVDPRARALLEKKPASRDRKRRSQEQQRGFRGAFGLQKKRR